MQKRNTTPLSKRVHAVKVALAQEGIAKSSRAPDSMGKFKYRGVDATMNLICKLHSEHGVCVRLAGIFNKKTTEHGKMMRTEADLLWEFYSSDNKNDCIETWSLGEGKDSGDKIGGKVHSYGYKNAMFAFYEIPTEAQHVDHYDPRIDNESEDVSGNDDNKGGDEDSNASLKSDPVPPKNKPVDSTPKDEEPDIQSAPVSGDAPPASSYEAPESPEKGEERMREIAKLIIELHDSKKISALVDEARWLKKDHGINGTAFELVRKNAKLAHVKNNKQS